MSLLFNHLQSVAFHAGFAAFGITRPHVPEADSAFYQQWLEMGMQAGMDYLQRHKALRADFNTVLPGVQSVICVAATYNSSGTPAGWPAKIARYAHSRDYHVVLKEMARPLMDFLAANFPGSQSRVCVDSAPLPERSLARAAGLGWIGRNTCLIVPKAGSWIVLAEVLTTAKLPVSDAFTANYCGSCTRCIDACPTRALLPNGMLDASRCISYLTIEHKGNLPDMAEAQREKWMFGCDICQEVCPWNRSPAKEHIAMQVLPLFSASEPPDFVTMQSGVFRKLFAETALFRTSLKRLKRNFEWLRVSI